jgi:hypothetical protein
MKIIFLDFDGVLTSVDSMVAFWHLNRNEHHNEDRLDPVCVGLIRHLCEKTGAKVVVSSVWRIGRTEQDFLDIFKQYGWDDFPYAGQTPISRERIRGQEIQTWLNQNPVDTYVIFDDDSDMLESQLGNFIHVSNINGFRSQHYVKALRLLGHPDERLEHQVNFVRKQQ